MGRMNETLLECMYLLNSPGTLCLSLSLSLCLSLFLSVYCLNYISTYFQLCIYYFSWDTCRLWTVFRRRTTVQSSSLFQLISWPTSWATTRYETIIIIIIIMNSSRTSTLYDLHEGRQICRTFDKDHSHVEHHQNWTSFCPSTTLLSRYAST